MADPKRLNVQIAKGQNLAPLKDMFLGHIDLAQLGIHGPPGRLIGIDIQMIFPGQNPDTMDMIAMLMGHKDGIQILWFAVNFSQKAGDFFARKAGIHQNFFLIGLQIEGIPTGA